MNKWMNESRMESIAGEGAAGSRKEAWNVQVVKKCTRIKMMTMIMWFLCLWVRFAVLLLVVVECLRFCCSDNKVVRSFFFASSILYRNERREEMRELGQMMMVCVCNFRAVFLSGNLFWQFSAASLRLPQMFVKIWTRTWWTERWWICSPMYT